MLQRVCLVRVAKAAVARPNVQVLHKGEIDSAIATLARMESPTNYSTEAGGLILETEKYGERLGQVRDLGAGFQGFCSKLHGLHARLALILHLLETRETISSRRAPLCGPVGWCENTCCLSWTLSKKWVSPS